MTGMHPPAVRRCQVYEFDDATDAKNSRRCQKNGTHWVKWSGCNCPGATEHICEQDFFSWECDDHENRPGPVIEVA